MADVEVSDELVRARAIEDYPSNSARLLNDHCNPLTQYTVKDQQCHGHKVISPALRPSAQWFDSHEANNVYSHPRVPADIVYSDFQVYNSPGDLGFPYMPDQRFLEPPEINEPIPKWTIRMTRSLFGLCCSMLFPTGSVGGCLSSYMRSGPYACLQRINRSVKKCIAENPDSAEPNNSTKLVLKSLYPNDHNTIEHVLECAMFRAAQDARTILLRLKTLSKTYLLELTHVGLRSGHECSRKGALAAMDILQDSFGAYTIVDVDASKVFPLDHQVLQAHLELALQLGDSKPTKVAITGDHDVYEADVRIGTLESTPSTGSTWTPLQGTSLGQKHVTSSEHQDRAGQIEHKDTEHNLAAMLGNIHTSNMRRSSSRSGLFCRRLVASSYSIKARTGQQKKLPTEVETVSCRPILPARGVKKGFTVDQNKQATRPVDRSPAPDFDPSTLLVEREEEGHEAVNALKKDLSVNLGWGSLTTDHTQVWLKNVVHPGPSQMDPTVMTDESSIFDPVSSSAQEKEIAVQELLSRNRTERLRRGQPLQAFQGSCMASKPEWPSSLDELGQSGLSLSSYGSDKSLLALSRAESSRHSRVAHRLGRKWWGPNPAGIGSEKDDSLVFTRVDCSPDVSDVGDHDEISEPVSLTPATRPLTRKEAGGVEDTTFDEPRSVATFEEVVESMEVRYRKDVEFDSNDRHLHEFAHAQQLYELYLDWLNEVIDKQPAMERLDDLLSEHGSEEGNQRFMLQRLKRNESLLQNHPDVGVLVYVFMSHVCQVKLHWRITPRLSNRDIGLAYASSVRKRRFAPLLRVSPRGLPIGFKGDHTRATYVATVGAGKMLRGLDGRACEDVVDLLESGPPKD